MDEVALSRSYTLMVDAPGSDFLVGGSGYH